MTDATDTKYPAFHVTGFTALIVVSGQISRMKDDVGIVINAMRSRIRGGEDGSHNVSGNRFATYTGDGVLTVVQTKT